ncbi:MAG: hypothetical protein MJ072_02420, partial [Clostridia bacterium]|nr:hypothetical protein [Clostridia bacterium]
MIRGNAVNSAQYLKIAIRMYATENVDQMTVESKKETLAPISLGSLKAGEWKEFVFSTHQLHPDSIDISDLEFRYRVSKKTDLYIDYVKGIKYAVDSELPTNY